MDRFYLETLGGRGWPTCHFVLDRATEPHTVVTVRGVPMKSLPKMRKACAALNEANPIWAATPAERDSLTRLRDWAASTRAFTEAAYDPNAAVTSFVREEATAA